MTWIIKLQHIDDETNEKKSIEAVISEKQYYDSNVNILTHKFNEMFERMIEFKD